MLYYYPNCGKRVFFSLLQYFANSFPGVQGPQGIKGDKGLTGPKGDEGKLLIMLCSKIFNSKIYE